MVFGEDGELTLGVPVAQCALAHVGQLDGALGARVHEPITALRVEFGRGDDLCQLLHVSGLDVDDVETLVLNVEVPQVDAEIVTADEGLAIAVDGDAVDVVCVGVGVRPAGDGSNDGIMVGKAGKLEVVGILEGARGSGAGRATTACDVGGGEVV